MSRSLRMRVGLVLSISLGGVLDARAQEVVQISGRITTLEEAGVAGARVQVTSGVGATEGLADSTGHYRIRIAGGSSSYVVSVEANGLHPATRIVAGSGVVQSEVRVDFVLMRPPIVLPTLRVNVPRLSASTGRWTPGMVNKSRPAADLRRRPMEVDDVTDLSEAAGGTRAGSEGAGISLSGQPADQTRFTLDGASLEATVIPREAVGSIAVVTNTYDVARGQFTGGNVDVRTQAAGNEWGATVRFEGRHPWLQYGDASGTLRQRSTYAAVDAGGGGALVRDRLFAYAAFTLRQSESPRRTLENLDPGALQGLGLTPDSVARFLNLTAGFRSRETGVHSDETSLGSGLLRLDAALTPRHSLMVRLNGQASRMASYGSPLAVAGTGTESRGTGYGILAQLGSGGARLANDLKVQLSHASEDGFSSDPTAAGSVRITSESAAGGRELATLHFAGSPFAPREMDQRSVEITDNLLFTSADRTQRFRMGAEFGIREYSALPPLDYGSFVFASLDDLEEGRPAQFTRSLGAVKRHAETGRAAFFLGYEWGIGVAQLNSGLRAERSWYTVQRVVDPLITTTFGSSPGDVPSPWRLSPRVGFSLPLTMPWDRGARGTTIQGGIGQFIGAFPLPAMGAALAETGSEEIQDLVCVGSVVPTPDWRTYRADPDAIPTACVDGSSMFANRFPRVTLFTSDFGPPRVWRTSLSAGGAAGGALDWRVEASFLRGLAQPMAFDRNLRSDIGFVSRNEAGRWVHVPTDAIDEETGVASLQASRRFPQFGIVREVTGQGRSRAVQLNASAGKFFGFLGYGSINYSFTSARETVGPMYAPGGGEASVGQDPFALEWAPSPYAPRHLLRTELNWRAARWLNVDLIGRLSSGLPFTPMVAGDVNGDGRSNDRAFVFDPRTEIPRLDATAAEMEQLFSKAAPGVRRCLAGQVGRVAAPGSCSTPWSAGLDLRAALQVGPQLPDSPYRRGTVWLILRNIPSALDYLLNGPDGLRGWGQLSLVDNTLLTVQGFDPAEGEFRYHVNPRFGEPSRRTAVARVPMMLSIQARFALGTDRAYRSFQDALRRNSNAAEALTPENLRVHLQTQLPNLPAEVLARNAPARLYLSPDQAVRLQVVADSLATETELLVKALIETVLEPGGRYSRRNSERIRSLSDRAVALRRSAVAITQPLLTTEQWTRLPMYLRDSGSRFAPIPPERISLPTDW